MMHNRFKEFRLKNSLKQREIASLLEIPVSNISEIENNKRPISIKTVTKLYQEYELSPTWLITGKGAMLLDELKLPQDTDITQQLNALKIEFKQGITSIKKELEQKINARPAPAGESTIEEPNAQDYDTVDIPYAEGLAAGQPHEIFYDYASHKVNKELIKGDKSQYRVIKIKGTSMVNAGIPDKSNVLIKNDKQLTSGHIMVFRSGGELTIKRYIKAGGKQYIQWDDGSNREEELTPEWAVVASYIGVLK